MAEAVWTAISVNFLKNLKSGCKLICKLSIIVNEIIVFITRILARKKYGTSTIVVENIKFS